MFDEIKFNRVERLPKYVFAQVNDIKMAERRAGKDVIDFSMGNPDGDTPEHIREKLVESAKKQKHMDILHQKAFLNYLKLLQIGMNADTIVCLIHRQNV